VPYSLYEPDDAFELENELKEISGLSWGHDGTLAAVEDEHGRIYFLDPHSGKIVHTIRFKDHGDFEAIEFFGNYYYVMRSNGELFAVPIDGDESKSFDTGLKKSNDVEGLGLIGENLVAACKGDGEVKDNDLEGRAAYLLDDAFEAMQDRPFVVQEKDIQELIDRRMKDVTIHEFDPSAIALDPQTRHLWILSADRILCILDGDGKLLEVVLLDKAIFRQPEGICFSPQGDLYISSEADGHKPMLFRFDRK